MVDIDHGEGGGANNIVFEKDGGFAIKHFEGVQGGKVENSLAQYLLKKKKQNQEREESLRNLYVGITRAKELMYITGTISQGQIKIPEFKASVPLPQDASNFLDWIYIAMAKNVDFVKDYYEETNQEIQGAQEVESKDAKTQCVLDAKEKEELSLYLQKPYAFKESTTSPIWYSVTQINKNSYSEEDDDQSLGSGWFDLEKLFSTQEEKTSPFAGTAYHAVLEHIDYSEETYTKEDIISQMDTMLFNGDITQEQRDLINPQYILDCVNSEYVKRAREQSVYREQQFKLYVPAKEIIYDSTIEDKILVQGTFDLFIPRSDKSKEGILIDYKFSKEDDDTIRETYKKQLNIYARAIKNCMGLDVDKMYIYVLGQNKYIEIYKI